MILIDVVFNKLDPLRIVVCLRIKDSRWPKPAFATLMTIRLKLDNAYFNIGF